MQVEGYSIELLRTPKTSCRIASETCSTKSLLTTCFRPFWSQSFGPTTCPWERVKASCQQAFGRVGLKSDSDISGVKLAEYSKNKNWAFLHIVCSAPALPPSPLLCPISLHPFSPVN
ncbi:hypothetical protein Y032_0560g3468 [Ancylostoma ceylanicum]|uniref:Uncharacterized protein n=1 Tax=Ancylostoma ceylanicum TaxID=53326 RepID=A0A016WQX2_9BILA|nr:hypothetical protein Y032_0560g3468 [Ancylostoma ceylanicum]